MRIGDTVVDMDDGPALCIARRETLNIHGDLFVEWLMKSTKTKKEKWVIDYESRKHQRWAQAHG